MSVWLFIESAYKYFPTKMAFLPSHVSAIPVMLMCFWPCQLLPSEECPNGTRLPLAWLWRPFLDASDPRQGRSSALTFTPRFTVPGIPASQRPVPQPRTQEVAPLALPAPRLPARAPPPSQSPASQPEPRLQPVPVSKGYPASGHPGRLRASCMVCSGPGISRPDTGTPLTWLPASCFPLQPIACLGARLDILNVIFLSCGKIHMT